MPKKVQPDTSVKNEASAGGMSNVACHYVSLPKITALKLEDPVFHSSLSLKDRRVLSRFLNKNKLFFNKDSSKRKVIPTKKVTNKAGKNIITKTDRRVSQRTNQMKPKVAAAERIKDDGKKLITEILNASKNRKSVTTSPSISKPQKQTQIKKEVITKSTTQIKPIKKPINQTANTTSDSDKSKETPKRPYTMSSNDEDDILRALENSDSENMEEEPPEIYDELIESLDTVQEKMSSPNVSKQTHSKNIINLSSLVEKPSGPKLASGIVKKNTIPIQASSKVISKPTKTILEAKKVKNFITSPVKQQILVSSVQTVNKKPIVKPPIQKAITVQSVEAINSKAKSPTSSMVQTPKVIKQTATVTPLTKARKSFTTGPPKVNSISKIVKTKETVKSEPVTLLSELVGKPISPTKMEVVPLQSAKSSPSVSKPPITKNQSPNNNTADLIKILSDEDAAPSQNNQTSAKKIEVKTYENTKKKIPPADVKETPKETNGMAEEKPRTIYDLMAEINLAYPSWNLHIMPDTNSFCIAQINRGRLGMPVLKKCIELDENYNAKVFVHQYHCRRFDGQYDSEESIIALIHEINAIKA